MAPAAEPFAVADPSPWESAIVLGNGDTAVIRPLVPADRDALAAFHRAQSADSIYRRYFSPKPELSNRDLDHFTRIDMVDRVALVVESHGEFVAWSSYERWPGRNEAEAAFMVADEHQGEGIATLMLEHLAAIARANGIERFTAEVLADNRPMLAVFAKSGWPLQRRFDSGVVDLDWELATTEAFLDSVERREQRGDSRAVARILMPRAIAVIGASTRPGSVGAELWHHVASSVSVPKYAVNPSPPVDEPYEWCASVDDLPDDVSLAVIAVPADQLDATIDACIRKRMRGAVVVTAVDGSGVDVDAMVVRARRNGLRLIGPSSMGIASPRAETLLQAALVDVALPAGVVAISMQSGSLGSSLLRQAGDLRLGLSWFVSLGDKADVSANDLLQFWEEDANTKVVGMYTESFGNPRKFARIARRVSLTMPIVAVRTGVASVGALGGAALYQQAGLIEVPSVSAMLHTVRVLATQPHPRGPNIAVLTNSRSPGILARAALDRAGLVAVDGPVGLTWQSTPGDFGHTIRAAIDCDTVDGVVVIHAPAVTNDVDSTNVDIDEAARDSDKPVVAVMLGGVDGPIVPGSAVPVFTFPEEVAAVLGRAYAYGRWLESQASVAPEPIRIVDPEATRITIDEIVASGRTVADLAEQHRILDAYGIGFASALDATATTAAAVAEAVGFPVAIKATRRRAGRSVRSGVALDVTSAADVDAVVTTMVEALGSDADRLIVQAMTAPGVDLRIRCEHDDRLGVIVSVGLGGAQADVIADRTSRLAPVSPAVARTMLGETRIRTAIDGADIDPSPIVDAIVQAAQLAWDHGRVIELDLNPVIASGDGATVTDALIRISPIADADQPLRKLD